MPGYQRYLIIVPWVYDIFKQEIKCNNLHRVHDKGYGMDKVPSQYHKPYKHTHNIESMQEECVNIFQWFITLIFIPQQQCSPQSHHQTKTLTFQTYLTYFQLKYTSTLRGQLKEYFFDLISEIYSLDLSCY